LKWFGGLFIEGLKSVIDVSKYDLIIRLIASGAVITNLCTMGIREILARKRNEQLDNRTAEKGLKTLKIKVN
jgi:arginine deiminase